MEAFEIGDVVYLNSDGALQLTVESRNASGDIVVVWFDLSDELRREAFNPLMLHG